VPPFFSTDPAAFRSTISEVTPPVDDIADPVECAVAERGRYIVMTTGCIGCHAAGSRRGSDFTSYMAGGAIQTHAEMATYVRGNLTPDRERGIGRRTDDEIERVLRGDTYPHGHVSPTVMPWPAYATWTEEDRQAVVVYLRHLKHRHPIPEPVAVTP
jgi:mono/diheme cytochrome c family protein